MTHSALVWFHLKSSVYQNLIHALSAACNSAVLNFAFMINLTFCLVLF